MQQSLFLYCWQWQCSWTPHRESIVEFCGNSDDAKAPQCYVIRTLPVLLGVTVDTNCKMIISACIEMWNVLLAPVCCRRLLPLTAGNIAVGPRKGATTRYTCRNDTVLWRLIIGVSYIHMVNKFCAEKNRILYMLGMVGMRVVDFISSALSGIAQSG